MTTTRIKEKISKLVASQLPEFIQTDYTTFVSFIEAYYRFLEQDQGAYELIQNARSYGDIDRTTESFVTYFLKNYAKDIPQSSLANKRLLVKKIKDLYESKGSELSFKLLFNILFQTDVDVQYPYENVLIASDGTWLQRNSLRIETVSGNRDNILNRSLLYTSGGLEYSTPILEVKSLTNNLSEIFLDPNRLAPTYTVGDTVTVEAADGVVVFTGIIKPTTTSYIISSGGLGFKRGQIYTINFGGGVGTLVRVSNVSSVGAITELKFINYGYGYESIFSIDLDPTKTVSETADILSDNTAGFNSFGSILKFSPSDPDNYFLEDYVSDSPYTFTSLSGFADNTSVSVSTTSSKPANFATIQFTLGSLGRYPGSFTTNRGFLSEPDIRLQDDLLYQPFAYQTTTQIDISDFFDIVTQLIHPAGQRLFNNRLLLNNIDLNANVSVVARSNVFTELQDVIDTTEIIAKTFAHPESDSANVSEIAAITVNKVINTSTDGFEESANAFIQDYFAENYLQFTAAANSYIEGTEISLI